MKVPLIEIIYNKYLYNVDKIKEKLEEAEIQVTLSPHEKIDGHDVIFIDKNIDKVICDVDTKQNPRIYKGIIDHFRSEFEAKKIKNKYLCYK